MNMKNKELMIAGAMALVSLTPAKAAEDLLSFGVPVETTGPVHPAPPLNEPTNKHWPAHVCAEIQRVEKVVISVVRPTDRGMTRTQLLTLHHLHCLLDVTKNIAPNQALHHY